MSPTSRNRPPTITIKKSHTCARSLMRCDDNMTVVPVALVDISDCMKSRRAIGSKLASGSSRMSRSGSLPIASASASCAR